MKTVLAAATALCVATAAHAAPIPAGSTLNVVGNATFDATTVSFVTPADLVVGTGAFTALGTCTGCVDINPLFTYSPFTAGLLANANNLGNAAAIVVDSEVSPPISTATALIVTDKATLSLTGFDDTAGLLTLTVNQNTGATSGSFSATGEAASEVPEPAGLAIIGFGLLGLAFVRHGWRQGQAV